MKSSKVKSLFSSYEFVDLNKIVKNNNIVIKGCMNYGLKDFASAMYDNKFIKTIWDTECSNGLTAMIDAIRYYNFINSYNKLNNRQKKSKLNDYNSYKHIMDDIIRYNEIDCKVLYEILIFFRRQYNI
jgi:hypothetical protein